MKRCAGGWLALAMGLVVLAARPAPAQEKVGKVDMNKVYDGYTLFKNWSEEYRKLATTLDRQLKDRQRLYPLLIDEEWNQLLDLRTKEKAGTLTPAERQQLGSLDHMSNDRDKELADLQTLPDDKRTAQQKERSKELVALQSKAAEGIAEMKKKYDAMLADKDKELSTQLEKNINVAVEQLAKEQGLGVVVRADLVLWGGVDVTDALLAKLNAGAPQPPAGGATPPAN